MGNLIFEISRGDRLLVSPLDRILIMLSSLALHAESWSATSFLPHRKSVVASGVVPLLWPENSTERGEDPRLILTTKESRVVLQIQGQHDLASQGWIFEKL